MPVIRRRRQGINPSGIVTCILSMLFAAILILALARYTNIQFQHIKQLVQSVDTLAFAGVIGLTSVNLLISAEKWRLIIRALDPKRETTISWRLGFFYTSSGALLGQLTLPQISTALLRGLAVRLHGGNSFFGGVSSTLLEQFFDILVAVLLVIPTSMLMVGLITLEGWLWVAAGMFSPTVLLVVFGPIWAERWLAPWAARYPNTAVGHSRFVHKGLQISRLLARRALAHLFMLSLLRFVVLGARAVLVVWSVALPIAWWVPCVSLPAAQLSALVALTPGSLGITEWGWSTVIGLLNVSAVSGALFVFAHRIQAIAGQTFAVLLGTALLFFTNNGNLFRHRPEVPTGRNMSADGRCKSGKQIP